MRNLIVVSTLEVMWIPFKENCSDILNKNCTEKLCDICHGTILNNKIGAHVEFARMGMYVDNVLCDNFIIVCDINVCE